MNVESASRPITIKYDAGSILLEGEDAAAVLPERFIWDARVKCLRARACDYRQTVLELKRSGMPFVDAARDYQVTEWQLVKEIVPRPHQSEALDAWQLAGKMGTVCLPTGAGKTILAIMAIDQVKRPTIIFVPTIDLVHQWVRVIKDLLGQDAGSLGGGSHEIKDIVVSTYDSGSLFAEKLGARFGFAIFDECHHLPAPQYRRIAMASLAPFRLGLSATPERSDGMESVLYELVGPLVYSGNLERMVGFDLAPYEVETIEVPLTPAEREEYEAQRRIYLNFLKQQGIAFGTPQGWQDFIARASRTERGREAMKAYRVQKKLAQGSAEKMNAIWDILEDHVFDKLIIFTQDNETAYRIGRLFFLPVLTHHTRPPERKKILEYFRSGEVQAIVTSKVLNEGVDVPDASVGVVVSGSGAVREHVQRLGRILRAKPGKTAKLYEIISKGTAEAYVNRRRKQHHAYQRLN